MAKKSAKPAKEKKSKTPIVAIVMGSDSDWPTLKAGAETLTGFGVPWEAHVLSAHRTPEAAQKFASGASARGLKVIIAAAGGAAHLAGAMAAHSELPIIGVPVPWGTLGGLDALLSTVQMPPGVPVATIGIGSALNAAVLAVQILATADENLRKKIIEHKQGLNEKAFARDAALQEAIKAG